MTGNPTPVFYICPTSNNLEDCSSSLVRNYKNEKDMRLLKAETSSSGHNSTTYLINVPTERFEKTEFSRVKRLQFLILVYTTSDSSKYSITNINHFNTRTLREGMPTRGRASQGHHSYYRVAKLSEDARSVEVHLLETSGVTTMLGYR